MHHAERRSIEPPHLVVVQHAEVTVRRHQHGHNRWLGAVHAVRVGSRGWTRAAGWCGLGPGPDDGRRVAADAVAGRARPAGVRAAAVGARRREPGWRHYFNRHRHLDLQRRRRRQSLLRPAAVVLMVMVRLLVVVRGRRRSIVGTTGCCSRA